MKNKNYQFFNVIRYKMIAKIPKHLLNQVELIKIKRLGKSLDSYKICTDILVMIINKKK